MYKVKLAAATFSIRYIKFPNVNHMTLDEFLKLDTDYVEADENLQIHENLRESYLEEIQQQNQTETGKEQATDTETDNEDPELIFAGFDNENSQNDKTPEIRYKSTEDDTASTNSNKSGDSVSPGDKTACNTPRTSKTSKTSHTSKNSTTSKSSNSPKSPKNTNSNSPSPRSSKTSTKSKDQIINGNSYEARYVDELKMKSEKYCLVDTRSREEFNVSHIPNSLFIDDFEKLLEKDVKFKENLPNILIFYCSIGYRSSIYAKKYKNLVKEYKRVTKIEAKESENEAKSTENQPNPASNSSENKENDRPSKNHSENTSNSSHENQNNSDSDPKFSEKTPDNSQKTKATKTSSKKVEKSIKTDIIQVYNLDGGIFEYANNNHIVIDSSCKMMDKVHGYDKVWGQLLNPDMLFLS